MTETTKNGNDWTPLKHNYEPTEKLAIDAEILGSIHMTLQQARDAILADRFAKFAVTQINRDIANIESLV